MDGLQVEDLKQAPRIKNNNSRSRRGMNGNSRRSGSSEAMALNIAKPCCFCSSTTVAAMASPENLMSMSMNGSDQFPSPDSTAQMRSATTTPRRSSSFSSTSTSSSSPSSSASASSPSLSSTRLPSPVPSPSAFVRHHASKLNAYDIDDVLDDLRGAFAKENVCILCLLSWFECVCALRERERGLEFFYRP